VTLGVTVLVGVGVIVLLGVGVIDIEFGSGI